MPCTGNIEKVDLKQFEWKIADFFSLSTTQGFYYTSPSFVFNNASLHLKLYPGGSINAEPDYLSVFLINDSNFPLQVSKIMHVKKADGTLVGGGSDGSPIVISWGFLNFYTRSGLRRNNSESIPSDTVTIICILKLNRDGEEAERAINFRERRIVQNSDHRSLTELYTLSENFKHLSANKDSCDVVLQVENKEFKAHKAILMARSSVFAAMFQHDTLESQTGFIKIPDCDSESFQDFLDYLYCGTLEDVSYRNAFHLYSTSNKYDVQKLKEFCVEYLIQSLSLDNVCDIAQLADKYDEINLITEVQDFFNDNCRGIFTTSEWENMMINNYRLANKLLVEYSNALILAK